MSQIYVQNEGLEETTPTSLLQRAHISPRKYTEEVNAGKFDFENSDRILRPRSKEMSVSPQSSDHTNKNEELIVKYFTDKTSPYASFLMEGDDLYKILHDKLERGIKMSIPIRKSDILYWLTLRVDEEKFTKLMFKFFDYVITNNSNDLCDILNLCIRGEIYYKVNNTNKLYEKYSATKTPVSVKLFVLASINFYFPVVTRMDLLYPETEFDIENFIKYVNLNSLKNEPVDINKELLVNMMEESDISYNKNFGIKYNFSQFILFKYVTIASSKLNYKFMYLFGLLQGNPNLLSALIFKSSNGLINAMDSIQFVKDPNIKSLILQIYSKVMVEGISL